MADYQLGVIGVGNMGEAILRGVVGSNVLPHNAIIAAEPRLEQRQMLTRELGISAVAENAEAAGAGHVLLCVKPQTMDAVLEEIAPAVGDEAVVISIAAGVPTARIDAKLGGKGRIVRVMPNTPMLIGAGVSALCAGPRAGEGELDWTRRLFAASGKTVALDEAQMDAATAVSGSGPAYFFYLIEAMIGAGVAEGLDPEVARELAVQTGAGALAMLEQTGEAPEVLRARVTSPGGTTQKAIETMESGDVQRQVIRAVRKAAERSRELA